MKNISLFIFGVLFMPTVYAWKNWAGNQNCKATIVMPKNKEELIGYIKKAKIDKKTVRAIGSGHSWSDIVCNSGYLINTDKLNKVVSVNKQKNQVTVEAGIKLSELNKKLHELNLSLSNQGAITKQSLAGAISTATHGSGKTGTLASFITKVELVDSDGNLKTLCSCENTDLFIAARTSIGSLGIMTELTVQCEPLFKVKQEYKTVSWQEFLDSYEKLVAENDYIEFYWYVNNDLVDMTITNKVSNRTRIRESKEYSIDYSYKLLAGSRGSVYMEEEIAMARARFVEAAKAARQLVQQEAQKSSLFSGILFRFVSGEQQNILSPASKQDVVYFSITTSSTIGYESFFKRYYDLMIKFKGRPHWGKINYLTKKDAQELYGDDLAQFIEIRKKLDSHGLFSNEFTKRIFGW